MWCLALCPGTRTSAGVRKWDPRFKLPKPCGYALLFKAERHKPIRCPKCQRWHRVEGLEVIFSGSDLNLMKRICAGIASYRALGRFVPVHKFKIWAKRYHAHRLRGSARSPERIEDEHCG